MTAQAGAQMGKLRWHCRRGIKELDVLLTRYVDEQYAEASPAAQDAFQRLLEAQDPVIYAYCLGQAVPPCAELAALIERITAAPAPTAAAAGRG
jgi:antitoxin CptB